uniref:Valacyclovir hydrolase (inferred by orthology to a human protein) n=1 Tax=Strongyloides venezuelensis TaxID=75913 RepID=A0A0K0FG27_STRVS
MIFVLSKCCVLEYIILHFHQEKMSSEIVEDILQILDCKIGYCKYGSGPIKILMIPGGVGCYKKDFPESVLNQFDPNLVTIVCIDPPGYGKSRPPDRKQSVQRCQLDAKYCLELMKILKLEPFNAIGWSEGARTAIHVAGQGKDLVEHIVLIAASTKVDQRGAMVFKGMRNTNQWLPNAREVYLQHYSEDFLREQWAALCDLVSEVYEMLGGSFLAHNVLPQLQCPVLLMYGGQDRFVMDPKIISDRLKKCEVLFHAQANHDVHIKYSKWFAQNVYKFVTKDKDSQK